MWHGDTKRANPVGKMAVTFLPSIVKHALSVKCNKAKSNNTRKEK